MENGRNINENEAVLKQFTCKFLQGFYNGDFNAF